PPTLVLTLAGRSPTVTITAPASGAVVAAGDPVAFAAAASDPEDGSLTASIRWTSSLDGPLGTGGTIRTTALRIGTHTITAAVTDSGGLTGSAQRLVVVRPPNLPPAITIRAPADGSTLLSGKSVLLAAAAGDAEDGDLGAAIRWTSSRDGALGVGAALTTTT